MCSLAAAVQGMDETVNNGAQAIYLKVRFASAQSGWELECIIDILWYSDLVLKIVTTLPAS